MKEMTIKEKAEAYDEAIRRGNELIYVSDKDSLQRKIVEHIFPELNQNEDEKVREQVIYAIDQLHVCECTKDKLRAWVEKQGESNCFGEYCKAYHDGPNNNNMQYLQYKSEFDDVVKCLINGMKFYYEDNKEATWGTDKWSMPVKHIIEVLEKLGEQKPVNIDYINGIRKELLSIEDNVGNIDGLTESQWVAIRAAHRLLGEYINKEQKSTDKIKPKFNIGDKIKFAKQPKYPARKIIDIHNDAYYFDRLVRLPFKHQDEWELVEQKPACSKEDDKITDEELAQAKKDAYNDALNKIEYHSGDPTFDDGWSAAIDYIRKNLFRLQNRLEPSNEQQDEQKPAWSEEDESNLDSAIYYIRREPYREKDVEPIVDWLRILKERVQSKQELNKNDETFYYRTIGLLEQYANSDSEVKKQNALSCINWLKSAIKHERIIKYKIGDRVKFFPRGKVFTISDIDEINERYISTSGDSISIYEELISVNGSLNKDEIKCGDYLTTEDGTVIKVHDVDENECVHYFYKATEMTKDGGDISDNFVCYCTILSDCRRATQEEIDFLEKWVAHKKYVWVENNVSPYDEEED